MRSLDFNNFSTTAARQVIRAAVLCTLGACNADVQRVAGTAPAVVASLRVYLTTSVVEPLESAPLYLDVHDTQGRGVAAGAGAASWTSSDESIASVSGGILVAHAPGDVTVTGALNGVSGSVVVHVAWRPDTRLIIGSPGGAVEVGTRLVFSPAVMSTTRKQILAKDVAWSSSNPAVARFQIPGELLTLAPGTTAIVAHFLGLADSLSVDIAVATGGFGYFYSGDATADDYDETPWFPLPGMSFTTAFNVSALWEVPYAGHPEFGWIGPATPVRDVMLQAVSLDNLTCAAYVQPDTGYLFVSPGAPLVECRGATFPPYQSSVRMEFLAFRPVEFTGTLGIIRPGWPSVSTTAGGITETSTTANSRTFSMPGVARDSVFWFVTPGDWNVASCAVAPADVSAPQITARVICGAGMSAPFQPLFYAVGFGPDARRGTTPIGLFEVSRGGVVTRKVVDGLDITTTRSGPLTVDVVVSGARMAAFDRVPAILVTAIATQAATCGITQPVRTSPTTVNVTVTCPDNASGFTLGVVY